MHLSLSKLPYLQDSQELSEEMQLCQQLNQCNRVNYAKVHFLKDQFLKNYFKHYKDEFLRDPSYQSFLNTHEWVSTYALFKTLKVLHNYACWEHWEEEYRYPSQEKLMTLKERFAEEIHFHGVLQYLCFNQFSEARKFAEDNGVFIKGDIPILINRDSADVWAYSRFFDLTDAAGAPPDMFSAEGQVWGFPLYNWEAIKQENFAWWKQRLHVAENFYHLYRLDHLVGFYRIWAVPRGKTGKEGYFIPSSLALALQQGEEILNILLQASPMFPIGEDLGMVPNEVRRNMSKLGIPGTKVMRWERAWEQGRYFIPYDQYPKDSMTTVSTHDSETLQQWWENQPQEARDFAQFRGWEYTYSLSKEYKREILRDSHHTNSLFHINLLGEYLSLIPDMSWPNPEDERINVPGTVSDKNWTYRLRPSVEELLSNEALHKLMQEIKA